MYGSSESFDNVGQMWISVNQFSESIDMIIHFAIIMAITVSVTGYRYVSKK